MRLSRYRFPVLLHCYSFQRCTCLLGTQCTTKTAICVQRDLHNECGCNHCPAKWVDLAYKTLSIFLIIIIIQFFSIRLPNFIQFEFGSLQIFIRGLRLVILCDTFQQFIELSNNQCLHKWICLSVFVWVSASLWMFIQFELRILSKPIVISHVFTCIAADNYSL